MIRLLSRITCALRGHRWSLWERRALGVFVVYRETRCDRCGAVGRTSR